eukprot:363461-Chlamydomonas_euryale.AAC.4
MECSVAQIQRASGWLVNMQFDAAMFLMLTRAPGALLWGKGTTKSRGARSGRVWNVPPAAWIGKARLRALPDAKLATQLPRRSECAQRPFCQLSQPPQSLKRKRLRLQASWLEAFLPCVCGRPSPQPNGASRVLKTPHAHAPPRPTVLRGRPAWPPCISRGCQTPQRTVCSTNRGLPAPKGGGANFWRRVAFGRKGGAARA